MEAAKVHLAPSGRSLVAAAKPRSSSSSGRRPLSVAATATAPQPAAARPAVDPAWREEFDKYNAAFFAHAVGRRNALRSAEFHLRVRRFPASDAGRKIQPGDRAPPSGQQPGSLRGGAFAMPARAFPATARGAALAARGPAPAAAAPASLRAGAARFRMPRRSFPSTDRSVAIAGRTPRPASPAPAAAALPPRPSPSLRAARSSSPSPSPARSPAAPLRDGGSAFRMSRREFPQSAARLQRIRTGATAFSSSGPAAETAGIQDEIARATAQWLASASARRAELRGGRFVLRPRQLWAGVLRASALSSAAAAGGGEAPPAPSEERAGLRLRKGLGVVPFSPRRRTFPKLLALSRLTRSAEAKVAVAHAAAVQAKARCEHLRRELFGSGGGSSGGGVQEA